MAAQLIATHRQGAEILNEDPICRQKIRELLVNHHLPNGLLPLKDITEFGYNKTTGFFWIKQQDKVDNKFPAIGKSATYEQELSAFVEDRRMRKISGVKTKELMMWVTISEFCVDEKNPEKLNFVSSVGVKKAFPVSAFVLEEEK